MACGQEGGRCERFECLCSAGAAEDGVKLVISPMKRLQHAARDSLARTLVSLRFQEHTALRVCVQPSSDCAAV